VRYELRLKKGRVDDPKITDEAVLSVTYVLRQKKKI
jgi:hypothetical protein